jgi:hypothetical protein
MAPRIAQERAKTAEGSKVACATHPPFPKGKFTLLSNPAEKEAHE